MSASRLATLGLCQAGRTSTGLGLRALASAPPPPLSSSAGGPADSAASSSSSRPLRSSGVASRAPAASSIGRPSSTPKSSVLRPPVPAPPPTVDDEVIERPPHLPPLPKNIKSLNRPLGVPDVPKPREFGFWELLMPAGNDEFRKAKMQAIMKEFRRSNLGNIMESWRTGGKGWIAPKSIFREDKALYLPNLFGSTLSSGKAREHTSNLCEGKISIVTLAGTEFAYEQVLKFVDPIDRRLCDRADFQVVSVSFQSTRLKAYLSSFFANNLRRMVPEKRWSKYIISTQDLKSTLEDQSLGIANNLAGYVYLVDENLKIRWAGCGEPLPEELDAMLVGATILLDRLDKVKGRPPQPKPNADPAPASVADTRSQTQ